MNIKKDLVIKDFLRLLKVIYILAKHNALAPLKNFNLAPITCFVFDIISIKRTKLRQGERLAMALEELGPIFIKIGQSLSTRPDLIGEDLANDLAKLRDNLPSFAYIDVEKIIKEELGDNIENLFSDFSKIPIAAASIAQVHKAKTFEGKEVAVKILRPDIKEKFKKDINLLYFIAKKINKNSARFKAIEIVDNFKAGIKIELDLKLEAAAASEIKENSKENPKIQIPSIEWNLTSTKVMTSEWIDGISVYEIDKLKEAGFDLKELSETITIMFLEQSYGKGFFHADMHPGNILINKEGKVALLDFGIMGRLEQETKIYVAKILYGFLKQDYNLVAKIHFDAGYVPKNKSMKLFAQSLRAIAEPIFGLPVEKISIAKLLSELFQLTKEFEMPTQPQLILLQKTMVLVEGIGYKLNPEVNMWKIAKPWMETWAIKNIGIEAKLYDTLRDVIKYFFKHLPKKMRDEEDD